MRNLKRFLAMVLTVLMVAGCFASISAKEFEDIDSDYAYAQAIDVLSDLGIIQGYGDDFKPDVDLARWHMALFLARLSSARVETADTIRIWYDETNYTPFKDLTNDTPIAAINYVYNFNMIVGTSATTFSPEDGITLQDALTMVVRALGYGSAEMDAGYPWKYIGKANELGLTDGLKAGVSYTDVLNRGEMAQVLYNALFAVKADGSSYADKFIAPAGETAVIITGVKDYQIAAVEKVQIEGYVSVNLINADGTLNTDVTYFLPASEFGFEAATRELVGRAFLVNTSDDFKTLDQCDPCAFDTYDTADFNGYAAVNNNPSHKLTIDGVDYKIVANYSFLYNNQGISKDGSNEIMVFGYASNGSDKGNEAGFQYDANYNILAANGLVFAYYVPAITGSYDAPYAYKLAEGVYEPIADSIAPVYDEDGKITDYEYVTWEQKIQDALKNNNAYVATATTYGAFSESTTIYTTDRFASIDVYDDDNDGLYERAFYKYWAFGKYTEQVVGGALKATIDNNPQTDASKVVAANDEVKYASGDYVRYTYDAITGVYTIDKVYTWENVGKIVSVSGKSFVAKLDNGETNTYYTTGIFNYPGATASLSAYELMNLYGYNVKVITETDSNGNVVVLKADKSSIAEKLLVIDNIVAMSTNGYVKATAYDLADASTKVIDIATINGYEYQQYILVSKLYSIYNQLESGQLWTAVLDKVSGNYHLISMVDLKTVENYDDLKFDQYTYKLADGIDHVANAPVQGSFLKQVPTTGDTVTIVRYTNELGYDKYIAVKRALNYKDKLLNITNAEYYVEYNYANGNPVSIKVLYIDLTADDCEGTVEFSSDNNKIVYVPANVNISVSTDNILGQAYSYTGLAMSNGEFSTAADVMTSFNVKLDVNKFYRIENKYVEDYFDIANANYVSVVAANELNKRVIVIDTDAKTAVQKTSGEWYVIEGTRLAIKSIDEAKKAAADADKKADEAKTAVDEAVLDYELAKMAADAAISKAYNAVFEAVVAVDESSPAAGNYKTVAKNAVEAANKAIEAMNEAADVANKAIDAYIALGGKMDKCEKYEALDYDLLTIDFTRFVDYMNIPNPAYALLFNFDDILSMVKAAKALQYDFTKLTAEDMALFAAARADVTAVKAYLNGKACVAGSDEQKAFFATAKSYWNAAVELYKEADGTALLNVVYYDKDVVFFNKYIVGSEKSATVADRAKAAAAFAGAL